MHLAGSSWPTGATKMEETINNFECPFQSWSEEADRYTFGKSSIPKLKVNRKRTSVAAGLGEDLLEDITSTFQRKLKLSSKSKVSFRIADALIKDKLFVISLMKAFPEATLRKLAVICKDWREFAYHTIRQRRGNNAFSIMWIDEFRGDGVDVNFRFEVYFHPSLLGVFPDTPILLHFTDKENLVGNADNMDVVEKRSNTRHIAECIVATASSLKKAAVILTYGTSNLQDFLMSGDLDIDGTKAMFPCNSMGLYVLSPSVITTTPDNSKILDTFPGCSPEYRLFTSVIFPECTQLTFECFIVPGDKARCNGAPCLSRVIGESGPDKIPKVLIIFQYINLDDSEEGIVEILQSLKTTAGSSGFPLVTGIYDWIDGCVDLADAGASPITSGILISGNSFCHSEVVSLNLLDPADVYDKYLMQTRSFYEKYNFSCKYAFLFYHNNIRSSNDGLQSFIFKFRQILPEVRVHGLGSLSGAHSMFVNPDAKNEWRKLNSDMRKITGTAQSKEGPDSHRLIMVLLTYDSDK